MFIWLKSLVCVLAVAAIATDLPAATYRLQPGSRIQLNGSSTVHDWSFDSREVSGSVFIPVGYDVIDQLFAEWTASQPPDLETAYGRRDTIQSWSGHLTMPVDSLENDNPRQKRDMQQALKGDQFPIITCSLTNVVAIRPVEQTTDALLIQTLGYLEIAGQRRPATIAFTATPNGDRTYRAEGRVQIRMSDFDIDPPSAMFGLLRAHDDVDLAFTLLFDRTDGDRQVPLSDQPQDAE
ncbi:MAG: YceI family protein [Verrucomicrobia bacterium]|nr:YceI family protein [Verrucomicrobiota bacterium]